MSHGTNGTQATDERYRSSTVSVVYVSCVLYDCSSATMRVSSLLLRAGGEAGSGHAFAQATFVEKILLEPLELLVERVVGLVNETNEDVGDDVAGAGIEKLAIGLIGHILFCAELANIQGFLAVFVPEGVVSHAQEVAVVLQQFFEAGSGDVGEFELGPRFRAGSE